MFRATQAQAQAQVLPEPQAPITTSSAEEEALKRKTDCVYFLASPLTCKKGSECEYRHSDIARVNPRDCWYWLNGNCLNPKCAFRHPPLDGLLGTQVPTPTGSSVPPSQTAATTAVHAPYISAKQAVPCIFFQKGLCLKGEKCSFIHTPNTTNNKAPQVPAAVPATERPILQKAFGGLGKCTQEQRKISPANVQKSFELPTQAKVIAKAETAPAKTGAAIIKTLPPPSGLDNELPRYRPADVIPATNGNSTSRSNRVHQAHVSDDHNILNGNETGEFSREPSPGFDVLVDDELGDSDYYQNEDQFRRTSAHEGRNLNPVNDYDLDHPANFNSMADVDRDLYHDPRGYDSYEHGQGQYARDQHRASSDRMLGGSAHTERRRYPRTESPDRIEESDLRHRLSKQRRVNGLRSVITHDHVRDDQVEDQSYRGLRRETQNLPSHESSLSSRLRGRIKIPGRSSSPVHGTDLCPEREMDRGRNNRGRLSPGRPQLTSHQGRIRDRIKGRVQEDFENEGINFRGGLHMRRDLINDGETDFAGPKSLAQLKVGKNTEGNEQQLSDRHSLSLGKRKYQKMEDNRQYTDGISFEGPKPLSLILKKKREADTTASGGGLMSGNKTRVETEKQGDFPSVSNKQEGKSPVDSSNTKEEFKSATSGFNVREFETEEGMIVDVEASADHEPEASFIDHQRGDGGDSEYEQVDGEDYDGENAYPEAEEEYLDDDDDDDDGDDFEKKVGVMFL